MAKVSKTEFKSIKLHLIDPPRDITRMEIDTEEVRGLAESIEAQGLLQPIVVNEDGERYEIIAGHRRYLAVQLLKKLTILAKVVKMSPEKIGLARAVENLQRRDLTPVEEGVIYTNLALRHGMELKEIAQKMGKSPGVVRRRMDILTMPDYLQEGIHKKMITLTVAEELMSCSDRAHRQYLVEMAMEHGITKEVARTWVGDWRKGLRKQNDAGEEGGGNRSVMEQEIIYRPCDTCHGPVDIHKLVELRLCPACGGAIKKAMEGERNGES